MIPDGSWFDFLTSPPVLIFQLYVWVAATAGAFSYCVYYAAQIYQARATAHLTRETRHNRSFVAALGGGMIWAMAAYSLSIDIAENMRESRYNFFLSATFSNYLIVCMCASTTAGLFLLKDKLMWISRMPPKQQGE